MSNALTELFSDVADAIREKTGDTTTMKPAEFPERIRGIETDIGGNGTNSDNILYKTNVINFYDVYGNIKYSYSKAEAEALTELPPIPELEGYDAYSWNMTLDAINNVGGFMDVSPRYVKNDKYAAILVTHIGYSTKELTLTLHTVNSASKGSSVTIDWGDGVQTNGTFTNINTDYSFTHTYSVPGEYIIGIIQGSLISVYLGKSGTYTTSQTSHCFASIPDAIVACSGNISVAANAFNSCRRLRYIDVWMLSYFSCNGCSRLETVSTTAVANYRGMFNGCYNLKRVTGKFKASSGTGVNYDIYMSAYIDEFNCTATSSTLYPNDVQARVMIITGTTVQPIGTYPDQRSLEVIYVPDNLVSSYKSASYWGALSSIIKPLSEYYVT